MEHKLNANEGRMGTQMNNDANKSFAAVPIDARTLGADMFNKHIEATIQCLASAKYPAAVILDCLLFAVCENYAIGILSLIENKQIRKEDAQKAIDGLGPVFVEGITERYNEFSSQLEEEKANNDRANFE